MPAGRKPAGAIIARPRQRSSFPGYFRKRLLQRHELPLELIVGTVADDRGRLLEIEFVVIGDLGAQGVDALARSARTEPLGCHNRWVVDRRRRQRNNCHRPAQ
jgi:hypothetical protein